METLYRLSWLADKNGMVPVNWRAMETEELGSVYESLLELQPQLGDDGKTLVFASEAAEQKGNQRKTTGSYYTPPEVVGAMARLVDETLRGPLFSRPAGLAASDVTLADLRHEGFVGFNCFDEGHAHEPLIILRAGAGVGANVIGTSHDFEEVCRLIINGVGIGILPLPVVRARVAARELWHFPIADSHLSADIYLISNPAARHTEAERAYLDLFDEILARANPETFD